MSERLSEIRLSLVVDALDGAIENKDKFVAVTVDEVTAMVAEIKARRTADLTSEEREQIAAWLESETRAGHGTIAAIRAGTYKPEQGT